MSNLRNVQRFGNKECEIWAVSSVTENMTH